MADPFDEADLTEIVQALEAIVDTKEIIERAKVAGIDISQVETRLEQTRAKLEGIRQAFFPNR